MLLTLLLGWFEGSHELLEKDGFVLAEEVHIIERELVSFFGIFPEEGPRLVGHFVPVNGFFRIKINVP